MDKEINCLKHCNAICCSKRIYYEIWPSEAGYFNKEQQELELVEEGFDAGYKSLYRRIKPCSHLKGNICTQDPHITHGEDKRPKVCEGFHAGNRTCLKYRAENPDDVIALTEADVKFQRWYLGHSDY